MSETPSQPARITRRSFVKRTSTTAIVAVLALHAFRAELKADNPASASFVEITSFPDLTTFSPDVGTARTATLPNLQTDWKTNTAMTTRVCLNISCTPVNITQKKLKTTWRYYETEWTFVFNCTAYGQTSADSGATWSASVSDGVTNTIRVFLQGSTVTGTADGDGANYANNGISGTCTIDPKVGVTNFSGSYGTGPNLVTDSIRYQFTFAALAGS